MNSLLNRTKPDSVLLLLDHENDPEEEDEKIAAYLHDVLEDTDIPAEVIKDLFGESILQAVTALTRRDDEDYFAFIRRAKENSIAAKVKMADLRHNSDLSRIAQVTEKDLERLEKYKTAMNMLLEQTNNN